MIGAKNTKQKKIQDLVGISHKHDTITKNKVEEASSHKSAKTHADNVFVTRELDLCLLTPK